MNDSLFLIFLTLFILKKVSFASMDALPEMPKPEMASHIGASNDQSKASNANYLSINPGDEILFILNDNKTDLIQYLNLTNTSGFSLAYKIKITSPDKFRVKPGSGIIEPSQSLQILINFLKGMLLFSWITNELYWL
jgi:hypothetical protein